MRSTIINHPVKLNLFLEIDTKDKVLKYLFNTKTHNNVNDKFSEISQLISFYHFHSTHKILTNFSHHLHYVTVKSRLVQLNINRIVYSILHTFPLKNNIFEDSDKETEPTLQSSKKRFTIYLFTQSVVLLLLLSRRRSTSAWLCIYTWW